MLTDLKFAFRALRKSPGFAVSAILILALGIAANTSVFSVVEAVLLRPLPFSRPDQLYVLDSAQPNEVGLFNLAEFSEYRANTRTFAGLAAVGGLNTTMVDRDNAQLVQGLQLSADTFDLLGVHPAAGRLLRAEDDQATAAKVVVLGNSLWHQQFGGREDVIGKVIRINGEPRTIVGVLPSTFVLPVNGNHSDICVPLQPDADPARFLPSSVHYLRVIGRIREGMTPPQTLADAQALWHQLREKYPNDYNAGAVNRLTPLARILVQDSRSMLLTLLGIVCSLLLLVSVNVAGLLLVRSMGRQRELAIRAALGSSKFQLVRLLVAECLLLAVAGGVVGTLLGQWSLDGLLSLMPAGLPRAHDARFNGPVIAFTLAASLLAGLAPALAPLWLYSRTDLRDAISAGGRGTTTGAGQMRLRHILASIQIALALALLACMGLFLRSFWALSTERPGADPAHTITARLTLPVTGYPDRPSLSRFYEQLSPRLAAIHGVQQLGNTSLLPLAGGLATTEFTVVGQPAIAKSETPSANYRLVTPGYFEAMGTPLRQGRMFTEEDDLKHPLCVIVSEALANAFFPDHRVLGNQLQVADTLNGTRTFEIVGVVANVKQQKLEDAPSFNLYVPFRQADAVAVPWLRYRTYWVLRTTAPIHDVENALRNAIRAVDPGVAVASIWTLEQVADSAMAVRRFTLVVIGFLAGAALLLTIAGIYAVVAYGVARRTREIGVRLALGASGGQIFRLVIGEGLGLAAAGAAVGLAAAVLLSQLLASQLYGVGPHDPAALLGSTMLLFPVALLACWLPARRAMQVDPLVAMQAE